MSDLSIKIVPARVVDAQEMELLIDAFLADRVKETHKATAAGYRREIEPFRRWWRQSSAIHHHKLTQDMFTAFIHWCEHEYINSYGNKASSYTLHKITIRVRHMLTWTHQMGYVPTNITELCPLYHYRDTVKYYPKPQELAAIIKAPTGKERIRDTAFLAFSLSTGARRNEIVNAKIENLTFATPLSNLQVGADHSGYIHLKIVKGDAEGVGKGRNSVFCSKAGILLKAWIRSIGATRGAIFGLGYVGIQNVIRNVAISCKLTDIHQHAFRSAFIDHWAFKHAHAGMMASLALKLQVGHAIDKGEFGATSFYINTSNTWRNLDLIKQFHCSPLDEIDLDWTRYPVHVNT